MGESNQEFVRELIEDKMAIESKYVASIYSDIDIYHKYPLEISHFLNVKHSPYVLYYAIAKSMIEGGYSDLDIISVDEFVANNMSEANQTKYKSSGGYSTIDTIKNLISTDNIEKYYDNMLKYHAILKLHSKGYNVKDDMENIKPLTYEELSDYITGTYSEIFVNIELGGDEVVDIKDSIDNMLERADKGALTGIPYRSKILNGFTHGMRRGEMTILAARSGQGKTYLATNLVLPSLIETKQKVLIICNEEDIEKWQREIMTYIINNIILKQDKYAHLEKFNKERFFQGGFSAQEWELLELSKEIMNRKIKDGFVLFVNLTTFSMNKAVDIIKQYSSKYDIRYYILDTLKLDNDVGSKSSGDNSWLQLQQSSVKLFNTIKSSNKNSFILLTYQLNKQNVRKLSMESLGMSKNIVDVASTVILARNLLEEEKDKDKLKVTNAKGQTVELDQEAEYMILTLEKNRAGASGREFVLRTDKAHNIITDTGTTFVPSDR